MAVLLILAAGVLVPTVLLQSRDSSATQTTTIANDESAPEDGCTLDVVAAPDIAEPLVEVAAGFTAGGGCAVTVEPAAPADVAGALAAGWDETEVGRLPQVWVSDSSIWVRYVETSEQGAGLLPAERPSIARSPTLTAMPQPMAEELGWPDSSLGWNDLVPLFTERRDVWIQAGHPEWGPFRFGLADPRQSSTGMHALMSFGAAQSPQFAEALTAGVQSAEVRQLLLALAGRNTRVEPNVEEQLTQMRQADGEGTALTFLSAMPLSERDIWRYNRGLVGAGEGDASPPRVPLAGLYPPEGAVDLDYPYVRLSGGEQDAEVQEAAQGFLDHLLSEPAQARLQEEGFRSRDNVPGSVLTDSAELRVDQVGPQIPAPDGTAMVAALDGWDRVSQTGTTLAVIDVSGSMGARVPGTDATLLDLTVASALRGVELFTPGSNLGLWEFSTDLPGGEQDGDYRILVPIGPVDEEISDGVTRRQAIGAALQNLQLANDTALYDTTLAAYLEAQANHDGGPLNSVVLFTDGKSDGDQLSLEQLLEEIRAAEDPERPVRIMAIGWGPDIDIQAMQAIVEVTGGQVFVPGSPEEIAEVFIEVLTGTSGG